jgi:hypothetical protein
MAGVKPAGTLCIMRYHGKIHGYSSCLPECVTYREKYFGIAGYNRPSKIVWNITNYLFPVKP